jgi:phthalate 4,5-dioxygenase oxygenase subunit
MLKREDNERVTRVGPGTAMGQVMRSYWMPVMLSEELPRPDGDPLRVRLLGEDLVAFRDSNGRVGLLAHNCPHRGASLFFGRNEESGLRCVYHGWKFDVDGTCVDMPNEPAESDFKHKVHATAYQTTEMGGTVWAWMGEPGAAPRLPDMEWMRGPSFISKTLQDCNWLQALEGGIDTSHSSFLHRRLDTAGGSLGSQSYRARSTAPKLEVLTTEYGFRYAGVRHLPGDGKDYVRVYQFVMPFSQMRAYEGYLPNCPVVQGHMWVPIDDEQCWVYNWMYRRSGEPLLPEEIETEERETGRSKADLIPGTHRLKQNRSNDYLIDRQAQRTQSYTGIKGVNTQDVAVQESMGPIYDRTREHLGTADLAIITARRLLLEACDDVAQGRAPRGSRLDSLQVRAAEMVIPQDRPWAESMQTELVAQW